MSYYKATTFLEKIVKLLQLFLYFLRIKFSPKTNQRKARHIGILAVISKLDRIGGLELQAFELSSASIREGCLVTILTDRIDASPAIEFHAGFLIRRLTQSTKPLRLCISLFYFMIRHRPSYQIVHVHGITGYTILSLRLAKMLGCPALLKGSTENDFAWIFQQNSFKHRLYRKWILTADYFVAISQEMKKEMVACGISEEQIKRIPNAVNSNKFYPVSEDRRNSLRKRFSLSSDQTVFLFVGRLEARKGIDILLRAWSKSSPGLLWIVGSGPEEEKLKRMIAELQLRDVFFHGETRSPSDYYQSADVFVFPSLKEGFPGVVLEAMSCGLACIGTRIGGVVDQLEDRKQGLLVSPGSVDELVDAMNYAASNVTERLIWGRDARETVLRQFDISLIASRYHSLYIELLSQGR